MHSNDDSVGGITGVIVSSEAQEYITKKRIINLLKNATEWMHVTGRAASQTCDGLGIYKIFNKLTDYKISIEDVGEVTLCNYANLNLYDKKLVLDMRNHPEIKKWMKNQNK